MAGRSTVGTRGFVPGLVLGLVIGAFAGAVLPPLISGQKLPQPMTGAESTLGGARERDERPPADPAPDERDPAPAPETDQTPEDPTPRGDAGGGAVEDTGGG
jgi:hypothetical protein